MRKNVASQVICAQLVSKTDGSDVTTGTTTVYVTGDGGTQASGGGTVAHEGNGTWSYVPTQAETNYKHIVFTFVNTSAVTAAVNVYTVGQDFTAAQLAANATQLAGKTVSAAAGVTFPSSVASPTNITAATGITVSTNNDKTGYALSSAGVQAIWDALTSALTTVGSIGKRIVDYLTGDSYTRLGAPAGASVSADIAAVKAKTDNLPADPASNTQVNTRLAAAGYVAPDNAGVAAIKAKTDNLPADPASNTQVNTRLAAAAYTAPDNAGIAAIAADLAAKLDVVLSTRLAAGDYTSPLALLTQTVKKYNVVEVLRILEAALAGKVTGATSGTPGTTVIRDANDTKNVISSVGDGVGNRSAVTVDPT